MSSNEMSPKPDILIVDDTPANLQVLMGLLTAQGYRVRPAPSGALALQSAFRHPPDLILLDIMMPGMDGYEVCAQLKDDERTQEVPVIFLSALSETLNKVKAFSSGGVDYVTKPFQAEEVLARVNTHLTLYRLQREQRELFSRFANREVADEILKKGFSLGGRYVNASALFADIRSFTTITESQSPADTIELLNDYFGAMFAVVAAEGGIVAQIVGDGIMAVFGAPVFYEDHCLRAVRAAQKMISEVKLFNQRQASAGRIEIKIGIGIASGLVIAGLVGAQDRAIYTCVGDTVNTAARLETLTKEIGEPVLIDLETRSGIDSSIRVKEQGVVHLKGKVQTVQVFSVIV